MVAIKTKRHRSSAAAKHSSSSKAHSDGAQQRSRLRGNIGNIIGMVLLVVAAFVAGYLIGRAHPVVAAIGGDVAMPQAPAVGADGLDVG